MMTVSLTMTITLTITMTMMPEYDYDDDTDNDVADDKITMTMMMTTMLTLIPGLCGGDLYTTSSSVVLSFWNTSQFLSHDSIRCRWAIDAPVNEHVELNVTTVNLPSNTDNCNTDHLEFRDQPLVCQHRVIPVSYTHLTLPTIYSV